MRFVSFLSRTGMLLVISVAVGLTGCSGGGGTAPPPAPPTGVEATSRDGAVGLSWQASSEATGYRVYRSTSSSSGIGGSPVNPTPLNQTSYTDTTVENGTRYYYRVTAMGEGGESEPSSQVSVRPFPTPPDQRP